MGREIRVSLPSRRRAPVGHRRWVGQRPAVAEALHEVRVADEGPAEGDQVGVPRGNRLLRRLLGVAAVADQRAVEHLAELGQGHRRAEVVEAERQPVQDVQVPVQDVQVRKPEAVELTGDKGELLPVVGRPHVVERPVRREPHGDSVGGPDGRDCFDNFFQKTIAILHAPAVAVRSVVRLRLEEGVDEVAVGRVNLHAVEARRLRSLGGSPVVVHNPWNLGRFQRPGYFVGMLAGRRVEVRLVDRDGRGGDRELAVVEAAVGGSSRMPKLKEDHPALFMHGVRRVLPPFGHLVGVDARRLVPAVGLLGDRGRLGDEQTRRAALGVVFGHQAVRQASGPGPRAGQRRQDNPVRQSQVVQMEGLKEDAGHVLLL